MTLTLQAVEQLQGLALEEVWTKRPEAATEGPCELRQQVKTPREEEGQEDQRVREIFEDDRRASVVMTQGYSSSSPTRFPRGKGEKHWTQGANSESATVEGKLKIGLRFSIEKEQMLFHLSPGPYHTWVSGLKIYSHYTCDLSFQKL